ncbi:MAG: ABC transporter substrate-binding protein [Rhodobiaceae bacterium]|nr:ABC transporter substrate-binding protein [Rhodobiaceae bacterium]MCC0051748.1 ABC transporter substrate-binding protein [Rhodobiaceae bacterium]MCC0060457.1 ABC transporter substrate-binding protein [Rhodobiaceae bacterium]
MKRLTKLAAAAFALLCLQLPASAQQKLEIAVAGHGYFVGPLYVAVRDGVFKKYGYEANVTYTKGGALAFQACFTKQADVCITSFEHVLTAAAQGRRLVAIFDISSRPLNNVVADNELLEAGKGKTLEERVKLLKGKRVGTPSAGGSGEKMLTVLARQYGLELPGDIELVYLGGAASAYVGAMQNDLIDAGMPFEPAGVLIEEKGLGGTLVNMMNGEVEAFNDIIFMTVVAHPDVIAEKPDFLKDIGKIFAEAQTTLLDPDKGKAIMNAEFDNLTPEANAAAYAKVVPIWNPTGMMTAAGAEKVFNYLQPKGDNKIDFNSTFTNEFIPQ